MGVLPLQFADGESAATYGLDGTETFTIDGVAAIEPRQDVDGQGHPRRRQRAARSTRAAGSIPINELEYFRAGGILHYVLRNLASLSGIDLVVEIVGWAGAVLILLAYLLLSAGG